MKNFQDLSVGDYLRILRRRIWYFVVPAVLISAGAGVFAWRQASFYRSETTIQVANRLVPDDYIGSLVRETPADRIEFVRQQVRSRTFLARLVEDLQLAGAQGNVDAAVDGVGASIGFEVIAPTTFKLGYVANDPTLAQSVVKRLAERVMQLNDNIRRDIVFGADQFLDEALRQAATDLEQAEERLRLFNERHFRGHPGEADALSLSTLQSQLSDADNELEALTQSREAARKRLEEQRNLTLAGRTPPAPQARPANNAQPAATPLSPLELRLAARQAELKRLSATHPDRNRVQREVDELVRQVEELKAPRASTSSSPEAADASDQAQASVLPILPELDTLVEFAEAELKFELQRLDRVIATKQRARQTLAGQISAAQRRLNPSPEVAQEMAAISHEIKNARDRHTLLSNRKLTSELAAQVDTSAANETFRVVDTANLPQVPAGPNRTRNAAMGAIMGILLGLAAAAAREFLDTTLSDEQEASAQLHIPVLTSVPVVPGLAKRKLFPLFRGNGDPPIDTLHATEPVRSGKVELLNPGLEPAAAFSLQTADSRVRSVIVDYRTIAGEQYRLMRTTLSLMRKKRDKLQTILIASTIPNEGKTFAACCLAAILAQESRQRVLLIDADFRTASASRMLGLNGNAPQTGLCEVLRGEAQIETSVAECSDSNLYFLPAGGTVTDPTELLASPSLEATIRRCEELFDWVIIDSPPILALADANIILPVCDSALLVVRAGKTPTKLVKDSISRIGSDRICGVLMNGVRNLAPSRYYGNYYKYKN